MMATKSVGQCTYCKRQLAKPTSPSRTAMTRDHVMPKCVGGTRRVRCCRQCNGLKGDIHPSVWRWFTETFPGWWKSFETNGEVVTACRAKWGSRVCVTDVGRVRRSCFGEVADEPVQSP